MKNNNFELLSLGCCSCRFGSSCSPTTAASSPLPSVPTTIWTSRLPGTCHTTSTITRLSLIRLQELLLEAPSEGGRGQAIQSAHWRQIWERPRPAAQGDDLLAVYPAGLNPRILWAKFEISGGGLHECLILHLDLMPLLQMTYTAGNNFGWGPQSAEVVN